MWSRKCEQIVQFATFSVIAFHAFSFDVSYTYVYVVCSLPVVARPELGEGAYACASLNGYIPSPPPTDSRLFSNHLAHGAGLTFPEYLCLEKKCCEVLKLHSVKETAELSVCVQFVWVSLWSGSSVRFFFVVKECVLWGKKLVQCSDKALELE
jgi:hypothetical protein